jgi:omega-6 fatty acid desaturase (delta-12 desaturase)
VYGICLFLLASTDNLFLVLPLWAMIGLSISALFILGHDYCHGGISKSKSTSYLLGQICMLPSLHPYHQWFKGHNRVHHGHTTHLEYDFVWTPLTPDEYKSLTLFGRLKHRFYWSAAGAGFYYMIEVWPLMFRETEAVKAKRDIRSVVLFGLAESLAALVLGYFLFSSHSASYALWFWMKMVAVPYLVWNYVIGIAVYLHHIHPQIQWAERQDWSPFHAQVLATTNYRVSPLLNFFFHNIFLHTPHHVSPRIPFYNLKGALDDLISHYGACIHQGKWPFLEYFRLTFQCKLYDSSRCLWLTYSEALNVSVVLS